MFGSRFLEHSTFQPHRLRLFSLYGKMKFSVKGVLRKCEHIYKFLWIYLHLLKETYNGKLIFGVLCVLPPDTARLLHLKRCRGSMRDMGTNGSFTVALKSLCVSKPFQPEFQSLFYQWNEWLANDKELLISQMITLIWMMFLIV